MIEEEIPNRKTVRPRKKRESAGWRINSQAAAAIKG
jgi:hypothetical protein